MKYLMLLLLTIRAIKAEEIWIGIDYIEINSKGKTELIYSAGTISDSDLTKLNNVTNPDSFITIHNVMNVDPDDGTYEMNGDGRYSKEESSTVLYKIKNISRIIILKGDPRKLYKKRIDESEKSEKMETP